MKKIIVPIDYSSYSEYAFLSALKIAHKAGSAITCINVVATDIDWKNLPKEKKAQYPEILDMEAEAKEKLKDFISNHKLQGVKVEEVVAIGVPHEEIVIISEKQHADLIIIGAHGMGYQNEKFVGSNLQKVLRNADCPVLAVKKNLNGNDLRKMVFASQFSEESRPAFVKLKKILKDFRSSVHFLYVNTPSDFITSKEADARMHAYAKGLEDMVIHSHVYCHHEAEKGIIEFAERNKIGFIGLASTDRKGKQTYQIGTTDTVLYKSDIPVLSIKIS